MTPKEKGQSAITSSDQEMVLSSLEPEQLAGLKKHLIPRRHLKGPEKLVMWSLRIYLLFMIVVVIYQVWASLH
ncbi:MAG: hypothetical protein WCE53_08165 [Candidatus Acidiferrum sp.]